MKRTQRLTRIAAIVACLATLAFLIVGAVFHWAWTGFDKPLYDWMQLLIIPVVLALVAVWFNRIDKKNELALVQKRAEADHVLALDNQQEQALQSYLDRMSELLIDKNLRISKEGDETRTVARVRTLTMLYQLDARRANYLLAFLREAGLMTRYSNKGIEDSIISLQSADLHKVNLAGVDLTGVDLTGANLAGANLAGANLSYSSLVGANLKGVDLTSANLTSTNLIEASFTDANLTCANIFAVEVCDTYFTGANLTNASLMGVDSSNVDFSGANFTGTLFDEDTLKGISLTEEQKLSIKIFPF